MFCSNCGKEVSDGAVFCSNCGANIGVLPVEDAVPGANVPNENQNSSVPNVGFEDKINKVKDNEFVKAVKNDVGNSQSLNMIKGKVDTTVEKAKNSNITKKFNKKFVIIGIVVIAILVVVLNLHKCEECDEIYFGKKNVISFWGESSEVCDDCYEDFYSW
ncbi:MAG: zinc-ribbon domain-containing protein [Acutalibacteraceae bacterium]